MQILIVAVCCLSGLARASLEPAGYRPPGSHLGSSYLPPGSSHVAPDNRYEPVVVDARASSSSSKAGFSLPLKNTPAPFAQYLPANRQPSHPDPSAARGNFVQNPSPARQYIPANVASRPADDYLPPRQRHGGVSPPSNSYLTPNVNSAPSKSYLTPNVNSAPSNSYLTPNVNSAPSNSYLTPNVNSAPSNSYLTPNVNSAPSKSYLTPNVNSAPSNSYLTPNVNSAPSKSYLTPNVNSAPSNSYLTPNVNSAPSNSYLTPNVNSAPSNSYLTPNLNSAPSKSYLTPNVHSAPSKSYLTPNVNSAPSNSYLTPNVNSAPSKSYLTPNVQSSNSNTGFSGRADFARNGQQENAGLYSAPRAEASSSAGYRYNAPENQIPAKYDFEYNVRDNYGNDYGHRESRSGESTQGVYAVALPDGRRQVVHYEADSHGYRPTITYEGSSSQSASTNSDDQGYRY